MPQSARSGSLSLDEIIDSAEEILLESGLEGLTMRAVATRLGVTPMAVYYYINDKEELLRLVSRRVSERWGPLSLGDDDWEVSLRRYLLTVWQELTRYPGLGAYMIGLPTLGVSPEALAGGIQFFKDAGFSERTSRLAWSLAMTYIHGRISVDAKLGHRPDAPRLEGLRARDFVEFGVDGVIVGLRELCFDDPDSSSRSRTERSGRT